MCDVRNCTVEPVGEIVTTFGEDEISIELCDKHQINYLDKEKLYHDHSWKSYASITGCSCLVYLCSMGNNLL